jgi:cyclopropane-fatty-acyl-phospholipid synthase
MTHALDRTHSSSHHAASDGIIHVTRDIFPKVTRPLPLLLKKALRYALGITHGSLDVGFPDGRVLRFGADQSGPHARIDLHDLGFARHLLRGGDIGFAEAYLRGAWSTPDLTRFLLLFCVNHSAVATLLPNKPLTRLWQRFRHWLNRNSRRGAKRNIHAHYDLGNRFYAAWLDSTMTYSSALFAHGDNDLSRAQHRKYQALAQAIDLRPEHHVLEIGCGWGGFSAYAAGEIGCKVTALTISQEQFDYASERMRREGLAEKVTVKLIDYRDETGVYDRIASIEMLEAVGENYWPVYFKTLRDRLHDGGLAGIQTITIQERLFEGYRREMDFIRRYIFPGGMLPTPSILKDFGQKWGLPLHGEHEFGIDYAQTLALWRERFLAVWPDLTQMGFDERFKRLWTYYLCYCEAGFLSRNIDVRQMIFRKV